MKIFITAMLVLLAVAAEPAAARQWRDFGGTRYDAQGQGQGQGQRQRPGDFQRQPYPQREFRQPERQPERPRDGRLTDDERRDLRRDLDRANREIYKGR